MAYKAGAGMSVRQAMDAVSAAIGQLRRVRLEEQTLMRKLDRAIENMRRDSVKEILEALEVEELNRGKHGIRVSALREEKITNLWQVHSMNLAQLVRVNGIGEAGAKKIKEIAAEFAKSAGESARIRLRADDTSRAQSELIDGLYRFMHTANAREMAHSLLDTYESHVDAALKEAAPLSGGLSRLFTFGRRKELAQRAYEYLAELAGSAFVATARDAEAELNAVNRASYKQRQEDFLNNAAVYIAQLDVLMPADRAKETASTGLPVSLIEEIDAMEVDLSLMKATLRPYQLFGCKYALHQGRVLLGDEMGLGKTVQAIAAMAVTAAEGVSHFMVVCPASVLVNWCREIVQHSHMRAVRIHGADEAALADWMENGGIGVTTYESISRFELPAQFRFGMLVVDEAHYVKNPEAKRTQAMQKLIGYTERVLFMSGTPLENRVEEMCFLISLLNDGLSKEIRKYTNLATAKQFREKLSPIYLRRTREDVLTELPDLIENKEWCELGKEEAAIYKEAVRAGQFAQMRQVSWQADIEKSSKAQRLLELVEEAAEEKRKVIIFTFFLKTIEKAAALLGDRCAGIITGSVPPEERQAMIDRLREAPDGSCLVCQVQAGGTGLNIQAASVIIFCEPQLKPSIEHQAVARAYRMGQVRDVMVHRLLCEDTVDERILDLLKDKQIQFDNFADESAAGEEMLRLDDKGTIADIVRMEQERLEVEAEAGIEAAQEAAAGEEMAGEETAMEERTSGQDAADSSAQDGEQEPDKEKAGAE